MKTELVSRKKWSGRTLVVLAFDSASPLGTAGEDGRAMAACLAEQGFKGAYKKTGSCRLGKLNVIGAGLGKEKDYEPERVRVAVALALKRAAETGADAVGVLVPDRADVAEFVGAVIEGASLGTYRFIKYRTPKPDEAKPVAKLALVFADAGALSAAVKKECARVAALCEAVRFTRDLGNEPSCAKPPEAMAKTALKLAKPGRVSARVYHKAELARKGMNGILCVGAGSHNPPCLVHLVYRPAGRSRATLCFVGKGITFDSGGISIKPSQGMEAMKDDMAGAASVFGLFHYLATQDVPVTVHGLVPLAENMPGGGAQRPGDVIRHYRGKTSEVISTDAEGRLILADALAFGGELKPDLMVDIATLTGACVVALGDEYSALMGTDEAAMKRITELGLRAGELFWQLPLPERYKSHIASTVADIKNTGKPMNAGTISAGLFLAEFVDKTVPWVHIDIAGAAFTKEGWDYAPKGATGVPLRTLAALVHDRAGA